MPFRILLLLVTGLFLLNSCKENSKNTILIEVENYSKHNVDTFKLDITQSIIYWQGSSPGSKHNGSLKFIDGKLYSSNNNLKAGDFNIDMKSISNLNLQDPSDKADLEDHLKDADFFHVDSFPTSQFKINSLTSIQDTVNNALVHGFLTIKNITKPLQLTCKIDQTENNILITVPEFNIDRTEFNIMFQSKKLIDVLKDEFINDEITLSIKIFAKKIGEKSAE